MLSRKNKTENNLIEKTLWSRVINHLRLSSIIYHKSYFYLTMQPKKQSSTLALQRWNLIIVCIGLSTLPSKIPPSSFLPSLQTVQPIRHKDVAKTSEKRLIFGLKDVLDWSQMEVASRRLPGDVLKTSSRKRPQDHFQKTSLRRLRLHQDFFW